VSPEPRLLRPNGANFGSGREGCQPRLLTSCCVRSFLDHG
jgi:hypothetical protein